jgi:outer membrane protein TolC
VERGAFAAITPDIRQERLRRVALNLAQLIRGATVADLPVVLSVDRRLVLNGRAASRVGYSPDQETRMFASFVEADALIDRVETLGFDELLDMAEAGNTSLKIRDAQVTSAFEQQRQVRSGLLPRLDSKASYDRNDTDISDALDYPSISLKFRQQLFNDSAWKNFRSSQRIYEGTRQNREASRLDVLAQAGLEYYELALRQSLFQIEADNLRLTEDFLELARLRRYVGYSGRDEILRWESQVAQQRSDLFRAEQEIETSRIALNQTLGIAQGRRWKPQEVEVDPGVFPFLDGRVDSYYDDYRSWSKLRDYLVEYSMEHEPELTALRKENEAQGRQIAMLKRRYYVPEFNLDVEYWERFANVDGLPLPISQSFNVGIFATYPIVNGGQRKHDLLRARSDLDQLSRSEQLVAEKIEQRTRTATRRIENSFPRIRFNRQSAESAAENLELVKERYIQGFVNVTDLLEAQNQSFRAELLATAAVFEFLSDLVELQRSMAWFEADKTPEEQDEFLDQISVGLARD